MFGHRRLNMANIVVYPGGYELYPYLMARANKVTIDRRICRIHRRQHGFKEAQLFCSIGRRR